MFCAIVLLPDELLKICRPTPLRNSPIAQRSSAGFAHHDQEVRNPNCLLYPIPPVQPPGYLTRQSDARLVWLSFRNSLEFGAIVQVKNH